MWDNKSWLETLCVGPGFVNWWYQHRWSVDESYVSLGELANLHICSFAFFLQRWSYSPQRSLIFVLENSNSACQKPVRKKTWEFSPSSIHFFFFFCIITHSIHFLINVMGTSLLFSPIPKAHKTSFKLCREKNGIFLVSLVIRIP